MRRVRISFPATSRPARARPEAPACTSWQRGRRHVEGVDAVLELFLVVVREQQQAERRAPPRRSDRRSSTRRRTGCRSRCRPTSRCCDGERRDAEDEGRSVGREGLEPVELRLLRRRGEGHRGGRSASRRPAACEPERRGDEEWGEEKAATHPEDARTSDAAVGCAYVVTSRTLRRPVPHHASA